MSFHTFNHGPVGAGDAIAVSVKDGDNGDFTEVFKTDDNENGYPNNRWIYSDIEIESLESKILVSFELNYSSTQY